MSFFSPKSTLFLICSLFFTQETGIAGVLSSPFVTTEIELELENETKKEELESIITGSIRSKPNRNSKPVKYLVTNSTSRFSGILFSGIYQKKSRTIAYHSLLI